MAANSPIKAMPEAEAAYQTALTALHCSHDNLDAITNASPVDWDAYNEGLETCASCQEAAQAAESVLQAAILNTPAVQDLIRTLKSNTQAMNQCAAELDKTATMFNKLAKVADTVTSVLGAILKYI